MNKKEKKVIEIIKDEIKNIVDFHNKNLTKKQYYVLQDSVEILEILLKKDGINCLVKLAKETNKEQL